MTDTISTMTEPDPATPPLQSHAVEVTAVYRTFEQDTAPVRALRGADLDRRARASSWP